MPTKTVRVGSARIDERGSARGGKAGDQTGKEVSQQDWYKHEKGWIVLRPRTRAEGLKIAEDMLAACDNPLIGYDQGERLTLYSLAKSVGFDCARVKSACETDCSALVRVCLAYAGIMVQNFSTANEASVLLASGRFTRLTDKKYTDRSDYLRAGDVLVTKTQGHTVVVLNDGLLAGDPEDDDAAPANPVQPDGSVRVSTVGKYHLRETPGILGKDKGVLPSGTTLRVYGRSPSKPSWFGVKVVACEKKKLIGEKGYISQKALPGMGVGA